MTHPFQRLGSVVATATVLSGLCSATTLAQSSDCGTAQAASLGSNPFDNAANTLSQVVTTNAAGTTTTTMYNVGWLAFTPATTGVFEFSLCGSNGDTKMAIGTECPAGNFISLAYNDDNCPCSSGCGTAGNLSWSSRIFASNSGLPLTEQLQAGTTYYIAVGSYGATTGATSGDLVISEGVPPPPPSDPCENVQVASIGLNNLPGNATNPDLPVSCGTFGAVAASKASYLKFTAPASGTYQADTCAATTDTIMAVLTACGDSLTEIACNDDTCGLASQVSFDAVAGQDYYIAVGMWSATAAPPTEYLVTLSESAPPSDPCKTVQEATLGLNSLAGSATNPNLPVSCGVEGATAASKASYLKFTAPATATYQVDTCAATTDTIIAVLGTCNDPFTEIACNDDTCGFASLVTFDAQAGQEYYIAVGLWSTTAAPPAEYLVNIEEALPPIDPCVDVVVATVGTNSLPMNPAAPNFNITFAGVTVFKCMFMEFTPKETGVYTVSNCADASFDSWVLTATACNDADSVLGGGRGQCLDAPGPGITTFNGDAGVTYYIGVGGYSLASEFPEVSTVEISAQICTPGFDPCADPQTVSNGANTVAIDCGAPNLDLSCCWAPDFGFPEISKANFVRYVAPSSGQVTVAACGQCVDSRLAVLTSCTSFADASNFVAADDDGCGDDCFSSSLTFDAVAGTTYFIAVGGYIDGGFEEQLPAEMSIDIFSPVDPCSPESVGTAVIGNNVVIPSGAFPSFDVTGSPCTFPFAPQAIAQAQFFKFVPGATGLHLFEQCGDTGTTVDARMALMTSCGDAFSILICDDDGCTDGAAPFTSRFEIELNAGETYYLCVGGYSAAASGPFNVVISGPEPGGCIPDLNDDGFVNGEDLGVLLGNWGACAGCAGDFTGDGFVNGEDLGIMLGGWGACP
jgi:hypothetical protein